MAEKLYTLTQVAQETNISMPTLQRYKKLYQDRIPSRGAGRTQRYPEEALDVFRELKKENMGRRGRPRKNASADSVKKVASAAKVRQAASAASAVKAPAGSDLLTLKQIEELTNISYPTLLRYVKTSLKRIPHQGTGRKRRYLPEAVKVFKTLREESRRGRKSSKASLSAPTVQKTAARRGRPPASASAGGGADTAELTNQLKELQKAHSQLVRQVKKLERDLQKPFKVVLKR